ncbi:MAG: CDP-alcohol phosphatidyltransferase family protein [Gammaproteobacteria bacterium]
MTEPPHGPQPLRQLPNAITVARLLSTPLLAWLAWNRMEGVFAGLLVIALFSDVVDGWLARRLALESRRGALLDSLADVALMGVVLFAIWPLHPEVYRNHGPPMAAVVALIALGHVAALLRFGRLASFHTRLLRAGIVVFSAFAVVLFVFGFQPSLLYLAMVVCAAGAVEQIVLVMLLPEWTPNFRGGIREAIRRRRDGPD